MNYSEIKEVKAFCESLHSEPEWREVIEQVIDESEDFCEIYVSADGYGHHFNRYDFGEEEVTINGNLYHVFDNR